MALLHQLLTSDHHRCDALFAAAETAASAGNWEACQREADASTQALNTHFQAEETHLFPAFEAATGMSSGPTAVMRSEHQQMRELLEALKAAASERREDDFFGASETLLVFMEQQNRKEEGILYPMCDQHIAQAPDLATRIAGALGG